MGCDSGFNHHHIVSVTALSHITDCTYWSSIVATSSLICGQWYGCAVPAFIAGQVSRFEFTDESSV